MASAASDQANITLRYHLSTVGAARLCLDLHRAPLQYYRGPIIRRTDDAALVPYARGCYAPGQPVILQKLPLGSYALKATVEDVHGSRLTDASCVFAVSRATAPNAERTFEPTYEWAAVPAGAMIPSGLEVKLTMHEKHAELQGDGPEAAPQAEDPPRLARIPPTWRLQVWVGQGFGFARQDVTRTTTVERLEAAIRASLVLHHGEGCAPFPMLWIGSERLGASETAEGATLFTRRANLIVKLTPCAGEEDGKATATSDR